MRIVWDEPKRQINIEKHGFDFAELTIGFFDEAIVSEERHGRFKAIGVHHESVVAVIATLLGSEAISVISMRPASRWERLQR